MRSVLVFLALGATIFVVWLLLRDTPAGQTVQRSPDASQTKALEDPQTRAEALVGALPSEAEAPRPPEASKPMAAVERPPPQRRDEVESPEAQDQWGEPVVDNAALPLIEAIRRVREGEAAPLPEPQALIAAIEAEQAAIEEEQAAIEEEQAAIEAEPLRDKGESPEVQDQLSELEFDDAAVPLIEAIREIQAGRAPIPEASDSTGGLQNALP